LDLLSLDAEPLRQQRIEYRGVALAGRLHVEAEHQRVAAGKAQRGPFERNAAGMLQHAGNAETAVFAALGRRAPTLLETVVIGERERLVEHGRELAAVDGRADGGLVGHRRRLDEVAPAQLHRVDAGHARGLVDDALEDEVRLW